VAAARDDRTARAVIRDEALRLFAERGPDAVRLREIAAAAQVSPGLVVHHFGSLEGLRAAVDDYVVVAFDAMLAEATTATTTNLYDPAEVGTIAALLTDHLPSDSPVPGYLRRILLADSAAGRQVFLRLFRMTQAALEALVAAGVASPGADPPARAAFLLVNDLAVLLLQDRVAEVLGVDPLSPQGMRRWAGEVLAVYGAGLRAGPVAGDG
jgi:TetR/AcrR family transcriptional regulator, regulator of cefoperazone and chloramphenicol sensitivity